MFRYEGDFRDGKQEGTGVYYFANGAIYEGEFFDDLFHGKGKTKLPSGETFEGNFTEGRKNGYGELKKANGDTYVGEFQNDTFHGKGKYTWVTQFLQFQELTKHF